MLRLRKPTIVNKPKGSSKITEEVIEQYRQDVIKGGRKYSYPIINTPKKVVTLSLLVLTATLAIFMGYISIRVYSHNDYSDFIYNVTKTIRLPAAWLGNPSRSVAYEDYLFELRRQVHYFQSQQNVDFTSTDGQKLLDDYRNKSFQTVVNQAYVKQLAKQHGLAVTKQEVDNELDLLRQQNKLGGSDEEVETVVRDFWGWSLADYRRSIEAELLRQKVVSALNPDVYNQAEDILGRLQNGEDFAELASELSDDTSTASNGEEYDFWFDITEQNAHPKVLKAVFATDVGGVTEIINTGYQLEILKVLDEEDDRRKVAHIRLSFASIVAEIESLKQAYPTKVLINLP